MTISRRTFFGATAAAFASAQAKSGAELCLFSKHLPDLDYEALGKTLRELGFSSVDLTTRPKGHVLPERVSEDLPKAVDILGKHGVRVAMITTELLSAKDAAAVSTLKTASKLGIKYFKPGYWRYTSGDVLPQIKEVGSQIRGLADLAAEHQIVMGLHNHNGNYVGEAVWDTWEMIRDLDPRWTGFYYDPGHAAIEGGSGGHEISLKLALPRLKMIALKDFLWRKDASGWKPVWCAMGEGAVEWKPFFETIAKAKFQGPVSLHLEYKTSDMVNSIRQDFAFVKNQMV